MNLFKNAFETFAKSNRMIDLQSTQNIDNQIGNRLTEGQPSNKI